MFNYLFNYIQNGTITHLVHALDSSIIAKTKREKIKNKKMEKNENENTLLALPLWLIQHLIF